MQRTNRQVDTVIFDLGGVLMRNGSPRDFTKRLPPAQAEQAQRVIMGEPGTDTDHPYHRLERGEIAFDEFRRVQGELLRAAGIEFTRTEPDPPSAAPFVFELSASMIELVHQLRAAEIRIGMLTNNIREFRTAWWSLQPWDELFDDVVDSHEVGMRKPSPAIYRLALERLQAVAGRTAFCDDLPTNVTAAEALGIHGVHVGEDRGPAIARVRVLAGLE